MKRPISIGSSARKSLRRAAVVAPARKTTHERGYDTDWKHLRLHHLRDEPLCRHCRERGKTTPAIDVDHIIDIADAPDLRLEDSNLQSLCKRCHSAKTRFKQSAKYRDVFYPDNLRAPARDVVIVVGAPCSGKSTYVRTHADESDDVIDLDEITIRLFKINPHERTQSQLIASVIERNRLLRAMEQPARKHRRLWFVTTASGDRLRWWIERLQATAMQRMDVPMRTCLDRCRADPIRASTLDRQLAAVRSFYA